MSRNTRARLHPWNTSAHADAERALWSSARADADAWRSASRLPAAHDTESLLASLDAVERRGAWA